MYALRGARSLPLHIPYRRASSTTDGKWEMSRSADQGGLQQIFLQIELLLLGDPGAFVRSVHLQPAHFDIVGEGGLQDLADDALFDPFVFDREEDFDAAVEVAVHEVGAAQVYFFIAAVKEAIDAGMFEEAPDDAADADRLAAAGPAGAQAADAADDQVYGHALARSRVRLLDHRRVGHAVELGDDSGGASGLEVCDLAADHLGDRFAQVDRRDQQFAVLLLARVPGQVVEQLRNVFAEILVGGEESEVGVDSRRDRVVVSRAEVDIAAQFVLLLAHDEGDLGMGLQPDQAVDDVDAGLLKSRRPLDVRLFVEAGLEFDQHCDLFAVLGGLDQRFDYRRILAHAVERLFDRQHARVARGLAQEFDHRRERLVRVVEQNVLVAYGVEDVFSGTQRRRRGRRERLVLQLRQVELVERHQVGDVQWAVNRVNVLLLHLQRMAQQLDHVRAHSGGDLQPHAEAEAAVAHLLLDRLEQVAGLVLFDFDVGVARDAEGLAFDDAHSREERVDVRRHHFFEHREAIALARDRNQPGDVRRKWQLDAGEAGLMLAVFRVLGHDQNPQVHADVRDVRERVARVYGQRRENGKDALVEKIAQLRALVPVKAAVRDDPHVVLLQPRQNLFEQATHLHFEQRAQAFRDEPQLRRRRKPVGGEQQRVGVELLLKARNADHKKLIEVGRKDREKFQPFEQRLRRVERLVEHAAVELDPTELAVEERVFGKVASNSSFGRQSHGFHKLFCLINPAAGQILVCPCRLQSQTNRLKSVPKPVPWWVVPINSILEACVASIFCRYFARTRD